MTHKFQAVPIPAYESNARLAEQPENVTNG